MSLSPRTTVPPHSTSRSPAMVCEQTERALIQQQQKKNEKKRKITIARLSGLPSSKVNGGGSMVFLKQASLNLAKNIPIMQWDLRHKVCYTKRFSFSIFVMSIASGETGTIHFTSFSLCSFSGITTTCSIDAAFQIVLWAAATLNSW